MERLAPGQAVGGAVLYNYTSISAAQATKFVQRQKFQKSLYEEGG